MLHESQLLSGLIRPADELERHQLELSAGACVVALLRLHLADGAPLSLARTAMVTELVAGLAETDPASVHEAACREYGLAADSRDEHVEVVAATSEEALRLEVASGSPLMAVSTVSRGRDGRPIACSYDVYRADRTRIVVSNRSVVGARPAGPDASSPF